MAHRQKVTPEMLATWPQPGEVRGELTCIDGPWRDEVRSARHWRWVCAGCGQQVMVELSKVKWTLKRFGTACCDACAKARGDTADGPTPRA